VNNYPVLREAGLSCNLRSSAAGVRITAPRGCGVLRATPQNSFIFDLKMVSFGAFWVI